VLVEIGFHHAESWRDLAQADAKLGHFKRC
jgi:hypothetical protein